MYESKAEYLTLALSIFILCPLRKLPKEIPMRKNLFIIAACVAGLGFTACSVDTSGIEDAADQLEQQLEEATEDIHEDIEEAGETDTVDPSVSYQCPDDCENGPVYDKPGPCKKCGKEMEIL